MVPPGAPHTFGGIEVPGHPVADFFSLTLDQVAELSYQHPAAFRINPAAMSEEERRVMAGNRGGARGLRRH